MDSEITIGMKHKEHICINHTGTGYMEQGI